MFSGNGVWISLPAIGKALSSAGSTASPWRSRWRLHRHTRTLERNPAMFHRLAPPGVPPVLEMEIVPRKVGSPANLEGNTLTHPTNEPRELVVGSDPHPRRVIEAGHRAILWTNATRIMTIVCMLQTVAGSGQKCQNCCGRRPYLLCKPNYPC